MLRCVSLLVGQCTPLEGTIQVFGRVEERVSQVKGSAKVVLYAIAR